MKLFIEYEMEKIEWFRPLSAMTKHYIIYKMEQHEFECGENLVHAGDEATDLIIVQEGVVQINTL